MIALACVACAKTYSPKPYAYQRIEIPAHAYQSAQYGPYAFDISQYAELRPRTEKDEQYWVDIVYPTLNATVHCSYKAMGDKSDPSLSELTRDALEFVYKHSQQASAIPEHDYMDAEHRVYGVVFDLEGNTASACQFFLTDSVHHFFRGALYCNCTPNADSLAPVLEYINEDMLTLIESFRWTR